MLLLQILAYNVECIVKAFSEGMIEIAQNVQENEKVSAEKMLTCTSGNPLGNPLHITKLIIIDMTNILLHINQAFTYKSRYTLAEGILILGRSL